MTTPRLHRLCAASALVALAPLACTLSTSGIPGGSGGAGGGGACAPGETRPCFSGPAGKADEGACKSGQQTCGSEGSWPPGCPGEVLPLAAEACDNTLDDDCNGMVNDGCACTPGEIQPCYSGPPATRDIGACKSGSHVCDAKGEAFGPCMGELLPTPEDCAAALDEDCDGQAPGCTGDPLFLVQSGTGPMPPDDDIGFAAAASPDGGFVFAGVEKASLLVGGFDVSAGSLSVFKTGADGKVLWAQLLAVSAGAGNHALARAVAVDADGGVVVAGELAGHLDFAGETLKSAAGSRDILVAKLDKTGKQLWAKIFGDGQTQAALGVAVDGARNIYLTGMVSGNVNFGGADLKGAVNDLFLVKLDASGAHQWSKVCGDSVSQVGWSVAATPAGALVLAGDFAGMLDLGGATLASVGGTDAFVAGLDGATGTALWAKRFGDGHDQSAYSVAVDPAGSIALAGVFRGPIDLGGGTINNADATGVTRDLFVARFDATGKHLWSRGFGDTREQDAEAVAMDGAGNVLLTGAFLGALSFGPITLLDADINNLNADLYVAKLSAKTGDPLWARRFGDASDQRGWGLAVGAGGSAAVTGAFKGTLSASPTLTLVSLGDYDLFALSLAP